MTLEQWRFQNPLDILLANEARSCKGCTHSAVVFDRQYCGKGKKHGRRCGAYQEKKANRGVGMQRDIDDVEVLLDLFAEDMRRPGNDVQGYPTEASGGWIPSWCKDTEEAAAAADAETLVKIHAAYDSLGRRHKDAINRHYSLGKNVWRFDHPATFDEAKIAIRVKFVLKGLL